MEKSLRAALLTAVVLTLLCYPAQMESLKVNIASCQAAVDPNYWKQSKTGSFIKSSAMENNKYYKYYKFTVGGEQSPVILLPNAEGTLKVTPLE